MKTHTFHVINHIIVKNRYSVPGKPFIQNLFEGYQTKNISKMKHKHRRKNVKLLHFSLRIKIFGSIFKEKRRSSN